MKTRVLLVLVLVTASFFTTGVSAQAQSPEPIFLVRVGAGGTSQLVNLQGLAAIMLDIAEGRITGDVKVTGQRGYDLSVARIEGCFLYLSGHAVNMIVLPFPLPINWNGTICLRSPETVLAELKSGRLPPIVYYLLEGRINVPSPVFWIQYEGVDGWQRTELFNPIVLAPQTMQRLQNATEGRIIAVYNDTVTLLFVKVPGQCYWRWQLLTSNGDNIAQGDLYKCV